jgi:hypothetical protein
MNYYIDLNVCTIGVSASLLVALNYLVAAQ